MAKKERAEKLLTKLEQTSKTAAAPKSEKPKDRRKANLPQPDFTHYKNSHAYPGKEFLFVGHSYNTECGADSCGNTQKRVEAIANVLEAGNKSNQWVTVKDAIGNSDFYQSLSRFERDWLGRLPESTLVGPAIDTHGQPIPQSFTVWRLEMRKPTSTPNNVPQATPVGATTTSSGGGNSRNSGGSRSGSNGPSGQTKSTGSTGSTGSTVSGSSGSKGRSGQTGQSGSSKSPTASKKSGGSKH